MKLVSWNVNGLRAVLGKGFLDYVAQEQPDIICLQETKCQDLLVGHIQVAAVDHRLFGIQFA